MNINNSTVVSSTGQPMFGVGGNATHSTHEYKGYCVSMEWDSSDGEPIMLIWSASGSFGAGVFGICLSSAGKYANPDGRPTEECFMECAAALPTLGRGLLNIEVSALVDVLMRFIPDLTQMPPAPKSVRLAGKGQSMFEITQNDQNGKTVRESLI